MFGLTQMMTYDENQSTQRPAGVIDHARPDRSTSEGKWNSISKRSSLKNYIVESPSAEFATFPDVAACSPSVSPAAFQRSSSYSLQDQINRNQPESTRINRNQPDLPKHQHSQVTGLLQMRIQPVQTAWRSISLRFVTMRCRSGNNSCLANLFTVSLLSTSAKYPKYVFWKMQGASCFPV